MRLGDLFSEAFSGLVQRPVQATVTVVGTAIGIGTLLATIGIARTAGNQIVTAVAQLAPTDIIATIGTGSHPGNDAKLTWDNVDSVRAIDGVTDAGGLAEVDSTHQVRKRPELSNDTLANVRVFAATPGLLPAVGAHLASGRAFDTGNARRADAVVLVGSVAASELGLREGATAQAIFIDDMPYLVAGIVDRTRVSPELLTAVIVPAGEVAERLGATGPTRVHVATRAGATVVVGDQLGLALRPQDPAAVSVALGPQPTRASNNISADIDALLLLLGALSLLVACFGIANISLVTVMERTTEIGLRRALGVSPADIGAIFMIEAAVLGTLGGITGASGGLITTTIVSVARDWTPLLDPWLPPSAVMLGLVVGMVAGAYPAVKAMRVEPIAALAGTR